MLPLENRWLTCCWIEDNGKAILIDCGEGTQIALKKAGCKLSHLEMLLFTHFHADHIAGLPGLLLTLGNHGKTTPLTICGPKGLREVVQALLVIAPVLPYPIELRELSDGEEELLVGKICAFSLCRLHMECPVLDIGLNRPENLSLIRRRRRHSEFHPSCLGSCIAGKP